LRCSRRVGLTLVEVVTAIVILGAILVGVILAKAWHTRQFALSLRKSAAVQAADELLSSWWSDPEGIPVNESGVVETDTSLVWETKLVDNTKIKRLRGRVVRLNIRELGPRELESPQVREEVLVSIELVLPPEKPKDHSKSVPDSPSDNRRPGNQP